MMKQTLTVLTCLALLVFSCGRPVVSDSGNWIMDVDVAAAMSKPATLKASEYFSEIRYIPLETSDSCLVGRDPLIRFAGEYVLLTSSTRMYSQVMLFDSAGKFIRNIGHRGNDPEGYGSVHCCVDEHRRLFYFDGFGSSLVCYDFDGKFVGKIPTPVPAFGSTFHFLHGDTLIGYSYADQAENMPAGITVFNASGEIARIPSVYSLQLPNAEIVNMNVISGSSAAEKYGPVACEGIIMINGRETASVTMQGATIFWHQGAETYFKEPFNDTIFVIRQDVKIPRLILELGEYRWDAADRFRIDKDKGFYSTQFYENKDMIFFRFLTGLFGNNVKSYNAIYHKATGNVQIAPCNDGIMDDITHFLPLQPRTVSGSGEYAGLLEAGDILSWFEKHRNNANIPAKVQRLKQLDKEDNPVLVFMK
jgi:hypothetical protein